MHHREALLWRREGLFMGSRLEEVSVFCASPSAAVFCNTDAVHLAASGELAQTFPFPAAHVLPSNIVQRGDAARARVF